MKSDVITVKNDGAGFEKALAQAEGVAAFKGLPEKDKLHLRLLTEEMLCMMRALTGEREAEFWIDDNEGTFALHLSVNMPMTAEARRNLLSVSSSGENSAAKGVMGKMRDLFERLLEPENDSIAADLATGLSLSYYGADFGNYYSPTVGLWSLNTYRSAAEEGRTPAENWDELEKSVVARIADDVQIGIASQNVEMTIIKKF